MQQEPYPFNLMSLDWSGEELEGWTRYEVPEDYADHGGASRNGAAIHIHNLQKQNGVDYALVLAIIETESGYRWDATSSEGSTGYMQVLAKWHEERMHRLNVDNVENPYFNIMVGVDYLAELQERFGHGSRSADGLQLRRDGCISARMEQRTDRHKSIQEKCSRRKKELKEE